MPQGQRPAFKFLMKQEGQEGLTEIGAAWATAKENVFSVAVDLDGSGEKSRFMMVPNKPKPAAEASPPARGRGRQRTRQDAPAA